MGDPLIPRSLPPAPAPLPTRCNGRTRSGAPCLKAPVHGAFYCTSHGGRNPNVRRNAEVRLAVHKAHAALQRLGPGLAEDPEVGGVSRDPRLVLLDALRSAFATKVALEHLLKDTDEADLQAIGSSTNVPMVGQVPDPRGLQAQVRIRMYQESIDRVARISKMALDAGIEERMVRLAESQALVVVNVIRAVLSQLQLADGVMATALKLAADELRVVSARDALDG